jgi:DNA helicase MCM8
LLLNSSLFKNNTRLLDLIFILLDKPDEDRDKLISEHILGFNASSETHNSLKRTFEEMESDSHKPDEEEMTFSQRLLRRCGKIASLIHVHQPKKNDSNLRTSSSKPTQKYRDASSPFNYQLSSEEIKRYIEYARQYVHPVLSPSAAKVLQKTYLGMRARSQDEFMMSSSNKAASSLPVTTRHLESMIRLAQARARIDLREEVTEQDANEIVQLLQESLLDIMTNEAGEIDVTRRGGTSLPKQMKALVKAMNREATMRGNNIFSRQEIADIANRLQLNKELDELIESMRTECYLLLKGPKLFQLQTV